MFQEYDVIVVGAGHAGCEAAHAAAKMGSKVMLITMNMNTIAHMSCNPAMGGVAKGQIVREIDALGGMSGIISDLSMIQFRMLNKSKGPAMWSPRTQNDRMKFAEHWRLALENNPNIDMWQEMVSGFIIKGEEVKGVKTGMGLEIRSKTVIVTSGTFLNGVIHIGEKQFGGGRAGERASRGITEELVELGFSAGRMKTGTPPRVDGRSLDYSKMEEQKGDLAPSKFSYSDTKPLSEQRSCHITYTNPEVHEILSEGFEKSPMFNGRIKGIGPRYCPSIEDKINRFSERDRHQIFVEPEGWKTVEVYVNGFSTSLPEDVQFRSISMIPGFEKAKMFRPGYAIEYDFFQPTQLKSTLETKIINNLFFAGQINGTTGYEEAACQGLIAGVNAHLKLNNKEAFTLSRSEAYMGVLIDDLINKGTEEPYRMFTSRAEYRLLLRQDNADIRLTPIGYQLGLADKIRMKNVEDKNKWVEELLAEIKNTKLSPNEINQVLKDLSSAEIKEKTNLEKLVKRPNIDLNSLGEKNNSVNRLINTYPIEVIEQSEILIKYDHYLEKERTLADKLKEMDNLRIPDKFNYRKLSAMSAESREKLSQQLPETLGQASRISGVSPADISVLLVHLKK
ncbi:tRNA uridine-5-carboxymethylaminomethyl(34) synthesis enzyme MnmG [Hyphobacterium sp. CCMP332]|nr:tRNA uridine-5-carboxymethylaminomethyl(34) synthesis enzyme MnmG [Hyphobacterium sp. CCMP332]